MTIEVLRRRANRSTAARAASVAVALIVAPLTPTACKGPPARLVAGTADTMVVNSTRRVSVPVRVLDAKGRVLDSTGAGARFRWLSGLALPVSDSGAVTCTQRGDALVRVTRGDLTTNLLVRCRPVASLRLAGPVSLVLGDSAQDLPILALGADGMPVDLLAGEANIVDSSVATLERRGTLRILPRATGATLVEVLVGGRSARAGVHVYERVSTLDGLRPEQRLVSVPLRLTSGEMHRWPLRAGGWMVAMLPGPDGRPGPSFRIDGAECRPALTERRYVCTVGPDASLIVYHPWRASPHPELIGELLLRRMSDP